MSNVFVLPKQVPLTSAGRVYPGAKAYFYRTGTNTPKAVYSDADLMTPITQPVTADLGGTFQVVYLDTSDGLYRVTLNTTGDALIYTVDGVGGTLTQAEFNTFLSASTPAILGAVLYPISAAESSAAVTPTNYRYNPEFFDPRRYGAVGDGVTDDTTAVQTAFTVAGVFGGTIRLPPGLTFLCTANITVTVGQGFVTNIRGAGWAAGGIKFSGAAVTAGLNFDGSPYSYCGSVEDLKIACTSSAKRCITFKEVTNARLVHCWLDHAAGCGVKFDTTLMSLMQHTLVTGCGSATEGSVEVVGPLSTTWKWDHSYISGGNTTVGGLLIDSTGQVTILGGAIESTGAPIKIGSKTDTSYGCTAGLIHGIDLENPGNNPYIEFGAGLSGVFVNSWDIRGCNGTPSGSAAVDVAVKFSNCVQISLESNNWALVGSPVATHNLNSTNNFGIQIRAHRNLVGNTYPWVIRNALHVKTAGPRGDWSSEEGSRGIASIGSSIGGVSASILVLATQGGHYRVISVTNASPVTMTALTGGEQGMRILLVANDGNTTLTHSTSVANQFNLQGNVNLNLASGKGYSFEHTGQLWLQV